MSNGDGLLCAVNFGFQQHVLRSKSSIRFPIASIFPSIEFSASVNSFSFASRQVEDITVRYGQINTRAGTDLHFTRTISSSISCTKLATSTECLLLRGVPGVLLRGEMGDSWAMVSFLFLV